MGIPLSGLSEYLLKGLYWNNYWHADLCWKVIDIHGGAFMLGHSKMVSKPQINDCLERGWIVLVPNHRLCPGVNLLEGPMQDIRDLLAWVYDGHLDTILAEQGPHRVDMENVAAFGTSSGGQLALGLVCFLQSLNIAIL